MVDSALNSDPLERYGAIERAYCEERWTAVIYDGQALLGDLDRAEEAPPPGLRERLELLIGHAFLYGLGDRDSAEDHYQVVLRSDAEVSLRQIAEQGLQQCALPIASAEPQQQGPTTGPDAAASDAFPVPQDISATQAQSDELAPLLADSAAALTGASTPQPSPQESWDPAASQTVPDPQPGGLGWLTPEAPLGSQAGASQPVMPWLETGALAAPAAITPSLPSPDPPLSAPAAGTASLPVPEAVLRPETTAASLQTSAPAEAVTLAQQPTDLKSGGEIASQLAAAGSPQPVDAVPPSVDAPQAAPAGGAAADVLPLRPSSDARQETLVPDVVEEPELIELHQAIAQHHEEVVLQVAEDQPAPPALLESDSTASTAGLDRRAGDSLVRDPEEQAVAEQQDRRATASDFPLDRRSQAVSVSQRVSVAVGKRPFSTPPEPVAEEDSELLMGLLKVEMG